MDDLDWKTSSVKIFVSHKDEDRNKAKEIARLISDHSKDVAFFFAEEDITASAIWEKEIDARLRTANMLWLLFTEETKKWDWCLYETGLFTDIYQSGSGRKPIVYFYKNTPPEPLKSTQGVRLAREDVSNFLKTLFHKTALLVPNVQPLAPQLSDTALGETASRICATFRTEPEIPYYAVHQIVVDFPPSFSDVKDLIPEEADISRTEEDALGIFGLASGKHSWGDISTKQESDQWIREIGGAVLDRFHDNKMKYPSCSIQSDSRNQHYLPILHSLNKAGSFLVSCRILLISVDRFCKACPRTRDIAKPSWLSWVEYWGLLTDIAGRLMKCTAEYRPDVILGLSHGGMAFADLLIENVVNHALRAWSEFNGFAS